MANENDFKVVRVNNISDFNFTGELGARYHGTNFEIPAGGYLLAPYHLGHHLAKHLARQILLRKAPVRDASQIDGKGSDRPLWDDTKIEELKTQILSELYSEERPTPKTETELMIQKVEELNRQEKQVEQERGGNADASGLVPTEDTSGDISAPQSIVYKDKAQVIEELTKRSVKFDARASKVKLEALLQ